MPPFLCRFGHKARFFAPGEGAVLRVLSLMVSPSLRFLAERLKVLNSVGSHAFPLVKHDRRSNAAGRRVGKLVKTGKNAVAVYAFRSLINSIERFAAVMVFRRISGLRPFSGACAGCGPRGKAAAVGKGYASSG